MPVAPGEVPDLHLELPGRLLRAAAGVLAAAVVAIAAFGAWRAAGDTEQEMAGAVALATLLHLVTGLSALDDARLLAELQDAKDPWAERVAGVEKNEYEMLSV